MSNPNILYEIVLKIKKYMDYSIRTGKKGFYDQISTSFISTNKRSFISNFDIIASLNESTLAKVCNNYLIII